MAASPWLQRLSHRRSRPQHRDVKLNQFQTQNTLFEALSADDTYPISVKSISCFISPRGTPWTGSHHLTSHHLLSITAAHYKNADAGLKNILNTSNPEQHFVINLSKRELYRHHQTVPSSTKRNISYCRRRTLWKVWNSDMAGRSFKFPALWQRDILFDPAAALWVLI